MKKEYTKPEVVVVDFEVQETIMSEGIDLQNIVDGSTGTDLM